MYCNCTLFTSSLPNKHYYYYTVKIYPNIKYIYVFMYALNWIKGNCNCELYEKLSELEFKSATLKFIIKKDKLPLPPLPKKKKKN